MFAIAILLLILISVWFGFYQLLKQQGRIILRLDALERRATGSDAGGPEGLEVGAEFPPFSFPDLAGNQVSLEQFRGKRVLLVHWSPECGFCDLIAPDLSRLQPELERRGVQLLLLAHGDRDANRKMSEEHGLRCPVLLYGDAERVPPLANLGSPAAYLLDARGHVQEPRAIGSEEVPALAHKLAQEAEDEPRAAQAANTRIPAEKPLTATRIERNGLKAGSRAPNFTLPSIYGRMVSLDECRGRRVLLVFSDPNCGPCDEAARELVRFHRTHGDDLAVMMIGRGDPEQNRKKAEQYGIHFPVLVQEKWRVSKDYGIFSTPVAFLIDEEGVIAGDVAVGAGPIMALAEQALMTSKEEEYELPHR